MEMSGKGSISRMSDECLMKGKSGSLYFGEYQAGMRKFTLAGKALSRSILICVICFQNSRTKGVILICSRQVSAKSLFNFSIVQRTMPHNTSGQTYRGSALWGVTEGDVYEKSIVIL